MNNQQIAEVFENIAGLLDIKGEPHYTVIAYQRAARTINHLPTQMEQMVGNGEDLKEIPGIGRALDDKIKELVNTGQLRYYEKLRSEFPDGIMDVMRVPGVGPKTASRLWDELGVSTVPDLEQAIGDGSVAGLPRLGKKQAENILREIRSTRTKDDRVPIARALPAAERTIDALKAQCPSITALEVAGSLRRFEETIGDIDLVCTASDPEQVLQALVSQPNVSEVLGHGGTKASVVLSEGIQVDLRVVEGAHLGALLQYFTGSQQHNVRLREHAVKMGLSLNEYGITNVETGEIEEFRDEEGLYDHLGFQYVPPELRQGLTELDVAKRREIPVLVAPGDLKGDLHVHTDWTDGEDELEAMVTAAKDLGHEYVAITDHSMGRGITNGLTVERVEEQAKAVEVVERNVGGIRVLHGTEVDIRADGSVDYPDDVLNGLDWVVASIHSGRGQERDVMTERIVTAMRNPHVDCIGHLSTRLIGERDPIEADYDALFRAAAETGTALEINASPARLDLKDTHIFRARELGVTLVIDSDAHRVGTLGNQRYGVSVARRGWCEASHILNTMSLPDFTAYLALDKDRRTKWFADHG